MLLSLIIFALGTEIIFHEDPPISYNQFDPILGWAPAPNKTVTLCSVVYKNNSQVFRSEEVDPSKDHILIFGNYVGYGWGVENNETSS